MTPKEQVLAFVRAKNPQTIEHVVEGANILAELRQYVCLEEWLSQCPDEHAFMEGLAIGAGKELGSPMGLQELLIALVDQDKEKLLGDMTIVEYMVQYDGTMWFESAFGNATYDLTKNLHNQSDDFYSSLLPLLS